MKKVFAALFVLLICLNLVGCSSSDYQKATDLFNNGKYAEAQAIFEALGDYEDSSNMAKECKYQNSLLLIEQKEYDTAKDILESLGDYRNSVNTLKEIGWLKFTDYLNSEGQVVVTIDDYPVILEAHEEEGKKYISVDFLADEGIIRQTFIAVINQPYPEMTLLTAMGHVSILSSYMDDEAFGTWDITTHKKGDGITWEEYECTGRTAQGTPLAAGTTGVCYDTELPLERLTDGIQKAIAESNTGISMSDLGFWAY